MLLAKFTKKNLLKVEMHSHLFAKQKNQTAHSVIYKHF